MGATVSLRLSNIMVALLFTLCETAVVVMTIYLVRLASYWYASIVAA